MDDEAFWRRRYAAGNAQNIQRPLHQGGTHRVGTQASTTHSGQTNNNWRHSRSQFTRSQDQNPAHGNAQNVQRPLHQGGTHRVGTQASTTHSGQMNNNWRHSRSQFTGSQDQNPAHGNGANVQRTTQQRGTQRAGTQASTAPRGLVNQNRRHSRNRYSSTGNRMDHSVYASSDDVRPENTNARNRSHSQQNYFESSSNEDRPYSNKSRNKYLGFKALEEISVCDPKDILIKLKDRRDHFLETLTNIPENQKDVYVLILQILSKVCLSSFDELKLELLLEAVHSSFFKNLSVYLFDLHYTETRMKERNKYYWKNPNNFWENLITLSETIFNVVPSLGLQKVRPILDICKTCLDGLNTRHDFKLPDGNQKRLTELHVRMTEFEQKDMLEKQNQARQHSKKADLDEGEPPENFRELSVVPSRDDLLLQKPFLRSNVVRGGYRDVEHYLDVQFRLLREDCFGPLREGIFQYIKDPAKQKYDNIRVYRKVRVVGPYVSKSRSNVGLTVQLDENTMKRLKRINWAHSKRFIFGSLLLFTNDNCRSFVAATIIDRDAKNLAAGRLPVSVIESTEATASNELKNDAVYVMIESEVYFEPYQHVLKVLRNPTFPDKLVMSNYIVNVQPEATPPAYLNEFDRYSVEIAGFKRHFTVLQPDTWPSGEELCLNESQYEALKLALTHEFAVIQGPPGTGKTFLGVKVARTLLANIQRDKSCLLLIICYTNHALDQFLEHILNVTHSVVRIGGQSRNPAMEAISLNNLRRQSNNPRPAAKLYYTERDNLRTVMAELQMAQNGIKSILDGVLSYDVIREYIPEVNILTQFYNTQEGDIIRKWLFENTPNVDVERSILEKTDEEEEFQIEELDEELGNARTAAILDDMWENELQVVEVMDIRTTFLLDDAEERLKHLIAYYRRIQNRREKQNLENEMRILNSRIILFKEMREQCRVERNIRQGENLKLLSNIDRWSVYFTWANRVITSKKEEIKPLQERVNAAERSYDEARMILDLHLIQTKKVVGLTTTGAARLRKLLEALAPPIVIVEEAAEVLEQHIVTALPPSCQHLILIGDHQQLRPSAAHMRLARHYNIDVSLFERMVNNGIHSRRLGVQHRMRPQIAALISPHIYKDLRNHPSVDAFAHVRGVTTDLFFFTHNYKEETVEDSASRSNHKEADMTLGLANYIMQQGYQPQDVTILAAYTGQMFYMKKERSKYAFLDNVKITVVDNYQGEESKIILLSLVRNNDQEKIGFLGTENRICVALSRAKEGFYIFGNIKILKANSKLWCNIAETLEETGSIGAELRLKCENHVNQFSLITSPKDFEKVPEGGCLLKCNYNLSACGHRCPRICHGYDLGHEDVKCLVNCERVICELRHPCPWRCGDKCTPCKQRVMKTLPCGHSKEVYCHQEPNDPDIKCNTVVSVILSVCGHTAKKYCHMELKKVTCMVPCKYRVECGHECRLRCHLGDDPDHERYECHKPCAKAKRGCSANLVGDRGDHQCPKRCHETCDDCNVEVTKKRSNCKHSDRVKCSEDVNEKPCRQNCARTMACGHFCKKKCHEPCGDCNQKVTKVIPSCKHKIVLECKEEAKPELCRERCERTLPCGHKCTQPCGKECDENTCLEIIDRQLASSCGHKVKLPCNAFIRGFSDPDLVMQYCSAPCNMTLKCEHACAGTCAQCLQGRVHVACSQPCHVSLICGHQCEEPCNQLCPPCKKPCEVKCAHSQCKKDCGAPCVPCQEPCPRSCPHGRCGRRCGEPCARAPCDAACPRALRCGHPCRGLCGEPCPDICRQCRPDEFPKDFLGDDFDDDAKFVKLQDCTHVLEVEDADNLMHGDKETIMIRSCPFCRQPIINTYRYKDTVNEMYKTEINPIKEKVYGTAAQVTEKRNTLTRVLKDFEIQHVKILAGNESFKSAFYKLQHAFTTKKKSSTLQLDMYFIYIEILGMVAKYYKHYKDAKVSALSKELLAQISVITSVLKNNMQKISQQQQEDLGREIKRLNSMIQLSKILSHPAYLTSSGDSKVAAAANEAISAVTSKRIYIEKDAIIIMKKFQELVRLNGIVTKEERELVVKAMGLKQGHWFKCPNGHVYCIGECGGAMQVGRCIECKAPIGGESHRLLANNTHAGDIDGSRFAAWSDQYNEMGNYNFD